MKRILLTLFLVTGCCLMGNQPAAKNRARNMAQAHILKLRDHFMGHRVSDLSNLISETREVSQALKSTKQYKLSNKFDSYLDVLMYGNNTIEESVKDVLELVKKEPEQLMLEEEDSSCCIFSFSSSSCGCNANCSCRK